MKSEEEEEEAAGTALEMQGMCLAIGRVEGGESLVCVELQETEVEFR